MPEHQQIQQSKKTNTIFQKQATPVVQTPASNPYFIIQRAKINPKSLTHADIMQLQRTIGNRAVGRLLTGIANTSTAQQATVQRQEIPEEEEPLQGKMNETVQRQEIPEEEEPLQGKMVETIQRQEIPEEEEPLQGKFESIQRQEIPEEEELLQGKFENKPEIACPSCFAAPIVQRQELEEEESLQGKMIEPLQLQEIPEEEEPLQGKMIGTVQRQEIPEEEEPLQTKRENNTGMPDNLKAGVESMSGMDMSDVRVHYNSSKPAEVGALAYTQGTNVHVAPGQERYLPHEAWHVVQQKQGRVQPTMQLKDGLAVNDDEGLEHEADMMGAKALKIDEQAQGKQEDKRGLTATQPHTLIGSLQRCNMPVTQMVWWVYDGRAWVNQETFKKVYDLSTSIPKPWKKGDKFDDSKATDEQEKWEVVEGEITKGDKQRNDLLLCIEKAKTAGNLYSKTFGSVVGGSKGTRVDGLEDSSSRIDVQAPPPGGMRNNVQFQVKGKSYAGVLFVDTDKLKIVLDHLLQAFDGGCKMKSPGYKAEEEKGKKK